VLVSNLRLSLGGPTISISVAWRRVDLNAPDPASGFNGFRTSEAVKRIFTGPQVETSD
jgi:hypothetical protein